METRPQEMIVIKNLVKQFGRLRAVDNVSLSVAHGKVLVVIGPSGSGKSTVLRCINHLETPTGGEIWVDLTAKLDHVGLMVYRGDFAARTDLPPGGAGS